MARNSSTPTISFECLHLYFNAPDFDQKLRNGAATAVRWRKALDAAYPSSEIANIVFIDDYSFHSDPVDRDKLNGAVLDEFENAGMVVDYIVYESDCAKSAGYLRHHLTKEPAWGVGSFAMFGGAEESNNPNELRFNYVSKNSPPTERELRNMDPQMALNSIELRNDIGLSVSIGQEARATGNFVWSCPVVAAWWQLIRLGALPQVDEPNFDGAPPDGYRREHQNRPDFICERTISLLEPSYVSVEHAVRVLLEHVMVDQIGNLHKKISKGAKKHESKTALDQISYIFDA